jgi:translocation and assembly module TamB
MAETAPKTLKSSGSSKPDQYKTRVSGGRWLMRGGLLLTLLATAVWFAPAIVAKTSLRQRIPKLIFPTYPGTFEVGETSIGWFSPIVVNGLKAEDEEGHTLFDAKEFSTVETLWTLATRQTNLGRMRLVEPVVTVSLRKDGSNLEDVYAKFMSGPASTAPIPAYELEIVNARIELANKSSSCSSTIEPVSLLMTSTKGGVNDLELTIGHAPSTSDSADDGLQAKASDWLAFRFGNVPGEEEAASTTDTQHLRLKARGWKLDKLRPVMSRFEPTVELSGEFDADMKTQLRPTKESFDWAWNGTVSLRQLNLSGLAALQHDKVVLDTLTAGGRFASQGGRLSMDDAKLTTDVGELTATGDIPLVGLTAAQGLNAVQSIVGDEDFQLAGHVDLKRLAALLPQTLRVREGTEITAGRLEVKLVGAEANGARTWKGGASLAELTAVNRGETIAWKTPFITAFQAHRQDGAVVVDRLTCQSEFLQVSGGGTLTDAHFTASGDLNKLEQNLERFIDLGLEKIAGRLKVDGSIKREENDRASLIATVHLDDFQWNVSADNVWQEDHLELIATAAARTDGGTNLKRIDSATLRLTSGNDSLSAKLNEAIDLPATSAAWPVTATLTGGLGTWQNRLKPLVVLKGWQLAGDATIEATLAAGPQQINLERLAVNIDQLQARGLEWFVQEPQLKLETSGVWKVAEREWSSPQSTLTASSLSCRIDKLDVALTKAGGLARLSGDAAYRADLDKLSRWKNQALERPSYHLVGALTGRATVTEEANLMTADIDASVEKLVVAALQSAAGQPPHWEAMWREPKLHLTSQGSYDGLHDDLRIDASSLAAAGLNLSAKGFMEKLSTTQRVDLTGQLDYDWDMMVERFGTALGQDIQLTGKGQRPFALTGSLASLTATTSSRSVPTRPVSLPNDSNTGTPDTSSTDSVVAGLSDLSGQAGLGWQSAIIYGLTAGPGDVSAKLDRGICQFAPLDMMVNDGRLHFTPQVRLDQSPARIVLPQEKVIDQVRLSPELCSSWLKFVMPLLADATEIEGKFSLDVAAGSLPLMAPTTGEMNGAVAIHRAQVRPGPFSMQIVGLVDQVRAVIRQRAAGDPQRERVWMEMPEQSVDFTLTQGRMHHRTITFQIKDVTLRTSGSVGMDETLNLIAEFGIPDDWVGNTKLLAGLKGKSIRIPIGGTLSRPQPDGRVLGELTRQLGGSALEGLFEKQLDNKLDGLFKKKLNKLLPE